MAGPVQVRALDLADLSSVRAFAGETSGPVDLLVNNAGLSLGPLSRTRTDSSCSSGPTTWATSP